MGFFSVFTWALSLALGIMKTMGSIFMFLATNIGKLLFHGGKKVYKTATAIQERPAEAGELPPSEISSIDPRGFVFGKNTAHYLVKPEDKDGHILVVGGAGSGKTSCLAIPTMMTWGQRVFAVDIKGELYKKTGAKRPNAKVFNPLDRNAHGFNPFYMLDKSENPSQDAREIALTIIPLSPDNKEPFWVESAQNLFTGALLHYWGEGKSFIETIEAIQSTPVADLVMTIKNSETQTAHFFVTNLVGLIEGDGLKALSSIASNMSNKIMIFATDQDIKQSLESQMVINPIDLERGNDIYLCIPEDKLDQWKGLLSLIVNQFMKHFERRPDGSATSILFLLDEFPRLGKVEAVNGLATLRSKKITICLICQSLAQLEVIYGRDNRKVIADNCSYKAILNATDAETQDYFSRLVGTYDKEYQAKSENYSEILSMPKGTSVTTKPEERRIIKPEEFATLTDIVLLTPYGFMRAQKTPYYSHSVFSVPQPLQSEIRPPESVNEGLWATYEQEDSQPEYSSDEPEDIIYFRMDSFRRRAEITFEKFGKETEELENFCSALLSRYEENKGNMSKDDIDSVISILYESDLYFDLEAWQKAFEDLEVLLPEVLGGRTG